MDQGLHSHHLHHTYSLVPVNIDAGGGDRFPQWSIQETKDLLIIRAELDPTFMETKRNKLLWEVVSKKMKEKGNTRSSDQCKCKWKNLVTRYKGCEAMDAEGIRQQFPFYNEMQAIFAARIQRMLWQEAEGGGAASSSKKRKKAATHFSSSEEEDENEESEGEKVITKGKRKGTANSSSINSSNVIINGIKSIMEEFMRQQTEIEMKWFKAYEAREEERRMKELEWRQTMEALEKERLMIDKRWREMEEHRKIREENRAEKRDALITALLNKLRREDNM